MIDVVTYIKDKDAFLVELAAAADAGVFGAYREGETNDPKVGLDKIQVFEETVDGKIHTISLIRVESLDVIEQFSTVEILNSMEAKSALDTGPDVWDAVLADPVKKAKLDKAYPRPEWPVYDNQDPPQIVEGEFWQRPEKPGVFA